MRSITEILIESDNTDDLGKLCQLWDEIRSNLYSYPLVQIKFAIEHLKSKARTIAKNDIEELGQLIKIAL